MKVNKILYKSAENVGPSSSIKVGSIIKGRIVDNSNEIVSLDIGEDQLLKCKSYIPINGIKGSNVIFIVKGADESKIIISPITDETEELSKQSFYEKILRINDVHIDSRNIIIAKSLINHNMAVNKDNLNNVSKIIDKIEFLSKIKESDLIYILHESTNLMDEEISNYLVRSTENSFLDNMTIKSGLTNNYMSNSKNINGSIMGTEDDMVNRSLVMDLDITAKVRKEIIDIIKNSNSFNELIDKVVFLYKSDIKVTIRNLTFLSNIIDSKGFFEKDLELLIKLIDDFNLTKENTAKQLINSVHSYKEGIDFTSKNIFTEYYKKLSGLITEIETHAMEQKELYAEVRNEIDNIKEKIEFLLKLNETNIFLYFPIINMDKKWSKILLLDKRKFNKDLKSLSIYVNIDTKWLNNIEVIAVVKNKDIKVDFLLHNKELVYYFKSKERQLEKGLKNCGFTGVKMNFKVKKDNIDILKVLSFNNNAEFSIDIKV